MKDLHSAPKEVTEQYDQAGWENFRQLVENMKDVSKSNVYFFMCL